MTNQSRRQATKGGEYGLNGEFYQGGQFLPSSKFTEKGKVKKSKRYEKNPQYKVEIDAYKWVTNRENEGLIPIFPKIRAIVDGKATPTTWHKGITPEQIKEQQFYCDLWNAGERWVSADAYRPNI